MSEQRGLRQISEDSFDVSEAIGGVRGLVEAVAPGVVFLVGFIATENLIGSLVVAVAVALIATVARLLGRTPVTQAVGGLFGLLISAFWAYRTGQAQSFYIWGLLTNAAFALAMLISMLARRPLVGMLVAVLTGSDQSWRSEPAARRRFTQATLMWLAAFCARLAVQIPLLLHAEVGWLGTARLVMGVPMWLLVLWLTCVLVRPFVPRREASQESPEQAELTEQADGPEPEAPPSS